MYAIQFVGRGPDAEALAINMFFLEVIGFFAHLFRRNSTCDVSLAVSQKFEGPAIIAACFRTCRGFVIDIPNNMLTLSLQVRLLLLDHLHSTPDDRCDRELGCVHVMTWRAEGA